MPSPTPPVTHQRMFHGSISAAALAGQLAARFTDRQHRVTVEKSDRTALVRIESKHGLFLIVLALLAAAFGHLTTASAQAADPTNTPPPVIAPVVTATARTDGSLVHVVGFGQTLAEIAQAYGVTAAEVQRLNGLPPDSSTLYSGQRLLIVPRGGPDPLLAQPATATPEPAPAPTDTPAVEPPAPTAIAPAASPPSDGLVLPIAGGLILLGGCLLLLAALVIQRRK